MDWPCFFYHGINNATSKSNCLEVVNFCTGQSQRWVEVVSATVLHDETPPAVAVGLIVQLWWTSGVAILG